MIRINIRKRLNMAGGAADLVVNAELPLQQITALYGKSGAGKTSLLKILAGLMQPEEGFIKVDGQVWLDTVRKINLPPQHRNIGFVFQDYALFPNMTVKQNLQYAAGKRLNDAVITHLLEITGLQAFADHKPETLSGGQKQRAALARALVRKPSLLLLDEPLSALDIETRVELQSELLQLQQEYQFSALLVSHDIAEIYRLANHILSIDYGQVIQIGTVAEVFGFDASDKIMVFGQVFAVSNGLMDILVDGKIYRLKYVEGLIVGDKVSLGFDAGDAAIARI